MSAATVSVVIPARGGQADLDATVASLRAGRGHGGAIEVVIVDDASDPPLRLPTSSPEEPGFEIGIERSNSHLGIARARNLGVRRARGEIVFSIDSHVSVEPGWDTLLRQRLGRGEVLACTIADPDSQFRGYGCHLVVPHMGTHWNRDRTRLEVEVASAAGTAIHRTDFLALGGYDEGMLTYGAAEPEFSVRAWLAGLAVLSCPDLTVTHKFKPVAVGHSFLSTHRTDVVHNSLRFGALYLDRSRILEMLRLYAHEFPHHLPAALRRLDESDVWSRRDHLQSTLPRDFAWFVDHFDLHDQAGRRLSSLREQDGVPAEPDPAIDAAIF